MPDTTSYSGPPQWMQQIWQNAIPGFFQTANRPYQQYQGPQVAGMSGITQNALGGYQSAMYGNPATWGGMQFLGNLIDGQSNPYLDNVVNTVTSDANKGFDRNLGQLNDIFSNPNSFGNARHELAANDLSESFGKGLGQSIGQLRYGAFNDDLSRRMQASQMAQGMNNSQLQNLAMGAQLGNIPREIQQQFYNQGQQNFNNWWNYPQQQSQFLAQLLGMSGQGAGQYSSTQMPNPNPWGQALGGLGLIGSGLGLFGR